MILFSKRKHELCLSSSYIWKYICLVMLYLTSLGGCQELFLEGMSKHPVPQKCSISRRPGRNSTKGNIHCGEPISLLRWDSLQKHGWLKGSCFTKTLTPTWGTTHGNCTSEAPEQLAGRWIGQVGLSPPLSNLYCLYNLEEELCESHKFPRLPQLC